jgi:two-component sensor histidine kinase
VSLRACHALSAGSAIRMIARFLKPLRHRLILLFAIVLVVPSIFGVLSAVDRYHSQVATALQSVARYTTLASNYEANLLWESQRIADSLGREAVVRAALDGTADGTMRGACNDTLLQTAQPYTAYGTAVIFDLDGKPLCMWDTQKAVASVRDRAWFQQVLTTGATTVSGRLVSQALGEPIIAFGAPLKDASGAVKGVVGLGIRLSWLASIGQESGLLPESAVYLLDRQGEILVSTPRRGDGDINALPGDLNLPALLESGERTFQAVGSDGVARAYGIYAIGQGQLFTVLGLPRESLIGPLRRDLWIQIAVLCVVSIAGMVAALIGARLLVTRWTDKLTVAARSMDFDHLTAEGGLRGAPSELGELGETLRRMAARIQARESELQISISQKQLMLREIHHRVKNNLQTVTSLMNLYARLPRGDEFKQAFADVQLRINTLALVHRHLYESQDLQDIDFAPFMANLCALLQDGSGISPRRVHLISRIPSLRMNGDRAVPLALLTTELVTNSFKHAFPNGRSGTIRVELMVDEAGNAVLTVADDGIGPPSAGPDSRPGSPASMGRALIEAFTKQLGGTLSLSGPPGMTTKLAFRLHAARSSNQDTQTAAQ